MGKRDDWFDDFMIMKMMEEDEKNDHMEHYSSSKGRGSSVIWGILILIFILKLLGA